MKALGVAAVTAVFGLCAGCIAFVVPTPGRVAHESRGTISQETLAFLSRGPAAKEDVLLHLGEPDGVWRGERVFLYWWETEPAELVVIGLRAFATGPVGRRTHVLLLEFNERGRVTRHEVKEIKGLWRDIRRLGVTRWQDRADTIRKVIAGW